MVADDVAALASARAAVLGRIDAACRRVGRDPDGVALVAVAKTVSADRLRAAVAAGLRDLGENRVQEAVAKAAAVPGATWHLVGPLQSNKARRAVETFATIQTIDSVPLARRVSGIATEAARRPVAVLLQVNVDRDAAKAGFEPASLEADLAELLDLPALDVRGLMTVGRLVSTADAARPTFVGLRRLAEALRARHAALGAELSMGMSDDFEIAVEEGATIVRVGRALFGDRPAPSPPPG